MDPFEKYDMTLDGANPRFDQPSPGKYAGQDNGWLLALIYPVVIDFDKSIINFPSIKRYPGGASNDLRPDLQHPENPVPLLDMKKPPHIKASGG
jgi:arylsulfatase